MVKVITKEGGFVLDEESAKETIPKLAALLQPGTPVVIQGHSWNSASQRVNKMSIDSYAFFSEGIKDSEGVDVDPNKGFTIQPGKTCYPYVHSTAAGGDFEHYKLVPGWLEVEDNLRMKMPWRSSWNYTREHTFSPAGPSTININQHGASDYIYVGEIVKEKFPQVIRSLEFLRDGYRIQFSSFYSMPAYLITTKENANNRGRGDESKYSNMVCLRLAMNLVREAAKVTGVMGDREVSEFDGFEVGWKSERVRESMLEKYPVMNDEDYAIGPQSWGTVGLIKVSMGRTYGETYAWPTPKWEETFKLAFSFDFVKSYLPFGDHGYRERPEEIKKSREKGPEEEVG